MTALHCAIIGGALYKGTAHPAWRGIYVFGNYCSGEIRAILYIDTAPEIRKISEEFLQIGGGTGHVVPPAVRFVL